MRENSYSRSSATDCYTLPLPDNCIAVNYCLGICIVEYWNDFFGQKGIKLMEWVKPWRWFIFSGGGYWREREENALRTNYNGWKDHYKMECVTDRREVSRDTEKE